MNPILKTALRQMYDAFKIGDADAIAHAQARVGFLGRRLQDAPSSEITDAIDLIIADVAPMMIDAAMEGNQDATNTFGDLVTSLAAMRTATTKISPLRTMMEQFGGESHA